MRSAPIDSTRDDCAQSDQSDTNLAIFLLIFFAQPVKNKIGGQIFANLDKSSPCGRIIAAVSDDFFSQNANIVSSNKQDGKYKLIYLDTSLEDKTGTQQRRSNRAKRAHQQRA